MKLSPIFFVVIILLVLSSCARVGRPTGGDKDVLPPISISASPDFETLNFKATKIKINFDEYIKFKELNKQLIISPPLNHAPEITPLGYPSKQISIKIIDTLRENTTYTFNFGNAIVDNSEGNPLKRFKYLFSTGSYIDSSYVSGTIQDAFLQETKQNISVMLYAADSTYYDSIVYKQKPNYVTNTLDSIGFSLTNIKKGDYFLFALDDLNNNLLFNPKDEKIAFIKEPIHVTSDSIFQLHLFKEMPSFAIKNVAQLSKNHIVIGYEGFLEATVNAVFDKNNKPVDFVSFKAKETDSIFLWHKDVETDSLFIKIQKQDTVVTKSVRLRSKEIDSLRLKKSIDHLLHFNDSLFILSNIPIVKVKSELIKLIKKDSSVVPFSIVKEKYNNKFLIDFLKEENTDYALQILPDAVTTFLGQQNDTLQFKFKTKEKKSYGEITVSLINKNKLPIILELLTEKGNLIRRKQPQESTTILFDFLKPNKYKLRLIIDENANNKWDSGNFLEKKQPERVIYHQKTIEVRANWTISEEFIIN